MGGMYMYCKRARKYITMVLSISLVLGTLFIPSGIKSQAAGKVLSLDAGRKMARSAEGETIFDQGTGDYGYKSLSQTQQILYDRVSEALQTFEEGTGEYQQITLLEGGTSYTPFATDFDDLNMNQEQAAQVWIAFAADHPWLFWLEDECVTSSNQLMPIVRRDYWGAADAMAQKREAVKTKIQQEVKEYLKVADYYSLCYDKVREMDERIIQAVDFAYQPSTEIPEKADWAHTIESLYCGACQKEEFLSLIQWIW